MKHMRHCLLNLHEAWNIHSKVWKSSELSCFKSQHALFGHFGGLDPQSHLLALKIVICPGAGRWGPNKRKTQLSWLISGAVSGAEVDGEWHKWLHGIPDVSHRIKLRRLSSADFCCCCFFRFDSFEEKLCYNLFFPTGQAAVCDALLDCKSCWC